LILESEFLVAKGLKALVSEVSPGLFIEYHLSLNDALEDAEQNIIDLFIVSVSLAEDDIGVRFARMVKQIEKYEMTFTVFLMEDMNEDLLITLFKEFYYFRLLPMPRVSKAERTFREVVSRLLAFKIIKRGESSITLLHNKKESVFDLSKILWIDIEDRVVTLNMTNSRMHNYPQSDYPLKRLKLMLGDGFIKIYRSTIVNKDYVLAFDCDARWLKLKGSEKTFKIGNTYINDIMSSFGNCKRKDGI